MIEPIFTILFLCLAWSFTFATYEDLKYELNTMPDIDPDYQSPSTGFWFVGKNNNICQQSGFRRGELIVICSSTNGKTKRKNQ